MQTPDDFFKKMAESREAEGSATLLEHKQRLENTIAKTVLQTLGNGDSRVSWAKLAEECQAAEQLESPRMTLTWLYDTAADIMPLRIVASPVPGAHYGVKTFWEMLDKFKQSEIWKDFQKTLEQERIDPKKDGICFVFRRETRLMCLHNYPHKADYLAGEPILEESSGYHFRHNGCMFYLERFSVLLASIKLYEWWSN